MVIYQPRSQGLFPSLGAGRPQTREEGPGNEVGDIHPKFFKRTWLREPASPYATEISLLRSLVASQQ